MNEIDQKILQALAQGEEVLFWDLAKKVGGDAKTLWARVEALAGEGKVEQTNSGLANDPFYFSITHLGSLDLPGGMEDEQMGKSAKINFDIQATANSPPKEKIEPPVVQQERTPKEMDIEKTSQNENNSLSVSVKREEKSKPSSLTIDDERGWVKLWRKTLDSEIFANPLLFKLWSYCLLTASHKEMFVPVSGFLRPIKIKPGQFITGRYALHEEIYPKRSRAEWRKLGKLGIKPDKPVSGITLWRNFKELEKMGNIKCQNVINRFSLVTIINWHIYQANYSEFDQPMINQRSTDDQPMNTYKNYKNVKKNIGRAKNPPDPRVNEFFSYWGETFQKEIGQSYTFSYARDGSLIKNLLRVHELPTLQQLTKTFFKDEQCKRRGLTIGIFFQEINRLVGKKSGW